MEVTLHSVADTALYAETLSNSLLAEPWVTSATWQVGTDDLPRWEPHSEPDVILVLCRAEVRADWINELVRRTQVRIVAVGVDPRDDDVASYAEAGASGFVFLDQSLAELRDILTAIDEHTLICPPRVAAALLRRVRLLANARRHSTRLDLLTERENEVLSLVAEGRSNKEISKLLSIDVCTVKNHVHHILAKLEVTRRGEAAAMVIASLAPAMAGK